MCHSTLSASAYQSQVTTLKPDIHAPSTPTTDSDRCESLSAEREISLAVAASRCEAPKGCLVPPCSVLLSPSSSLPPPSCCTTDPKLIPDRRVIGSQSPATSHELPTIVKRVNVASSAVASACFRVELGPLPRAWYCCFLQPKECKRH
jgi:hypothetical protein